jgi:hypothetical protein
MKHPKVFGKRPILMMRFNGSIRIIYPNGKVEWCTGIVDCPEDIHGPACTDGKSQKEAYLNAVEYDSAGTHPDHQWSAFLGYL